MKIDFVIPCLLGMESLIAAELRDFGADDVAAENGRVLFSNKRDRFSYVRSVLAF